MGRRAAAFDRAQSAAARGAATMAVLTYIFIVLCFRLAAFSDLAESDRPGCSIDLQCEECLPENMPLVRVAGGDAAAGGPAVGGAAAGAAHGQPVVLSCGSGRFLLYPLRAELTAVCEHGRYRVPPAARLLSLLDLGCQHSLFEDVDHQVAHCGPPLQGRVYQMQESELVVRAVAALCYDAERGAAAHAHAPARAAALPAPARRAAPLSLLANFNHILEAGTRREAERLYSDEARMNRRLREQFKHEQYTFGEQTVTSARLLAELYFEAERRPVADFVSNKVPVWRSVATANLCLLHRDVGELARARADVDVFAGTHGVMALGAAGARSEVFLKAGRRFPVPRYIWTVVWAAAQRRGLALVLLNDPFVAASELQEAVFCESACAAVSWLARLARHRDYERPANGLVFCCDLNSFATVVHEMPKIFNGSIPRLN